MSGNIDDILATCEARWSVADPPGSISSGNTRGSGRSTVKEQGQCLASLVIRPGQSYRLVLKRPEQPNRPVASMHLDKARQYKISPGNVHTVVLGDGTRHVLKFQDDDKFREFNSLVRMAVESLKLNRPEPPAKPPQEILEEILAHDDDDVPSRASYRPYINLQPDENNPLYDGGPVYETLRPEEGPPVPPPRPPQTSRISRPYTYIDDIRELGIYSPTQQDLKKRVQEELRHVKRDARDNGRKGRRHEMTSSSSNDAPASQRLGRGRNLAPSFVCKYCRCHASSGASGSTRQESSGENDGYLMAPMHGHGHGQRKGNHTGSQQRTGGTRKEQPAEESSEDRNRDSSRSTSTHRLERRHDDIDEDIRKLKRTGAMKEAKSSSSRGTNGSASENRPSPRSYRSTNSESSVADEAAIQHSSGGGGAKVTPKTSITLTRGISNGSTGTQLQTNPYSDKTLLLEVELVGAEGRLGSGKISVGSFSEYDDDGERQITINLNCDARREPRSVVSSRESSSWKCDTCSRRNANDVVECAGSWKCPVCTLVNKCAKEVCGVCDCAREAAFDRNATVREKKRVINAQSFK